MGALEEVRDLAEAVTRRRSLQLWDVVLTGEKGRTLVRVYVDGEGGVDLDTVAEVSEEISRGLDLRDPIEGRYALEVSSPGLERNLKSPEHFARSLGSNVVVKTSRELDGGGRRLDGELLEADEDGVLVATGDKEVRVPYDVIRSARTVFRWR